MKSAIDLESLLDDNPEGLFVFALVNLGLIQSLGAGLISPTEAVQRFYNARNGLFVRRRLRNKDADSIMAHGVQLPDLFAALPPEDATREFNHELEIMRGLCFKCWNAKLPRNSKKVS